ncbi:MAG TPA: HAD family hydrolase [Tepidisphaeraceae bacterium]|nr:HAD family hydrolase [Tepidisphaeraceae bacterium]
MKRPAIFFDRDNTLIVSDGYLGDPEKVVLIEGAAQAVGKARSMGFATVVISNQSGVARGMFDERAVQAVNRKLDQLLHSVLPIAVIDRHEYCPYHPEGTVEPYNHESEMRKPKPGMILLAAEKLALDLSRSWLIGDAPRDIEAGKAAGCRTILLKISGLPASPAADEKVESPPDFVAGSLKEALSIVEKHLEAARPSEEPEPASAPRPQPTAANRLEQLAEQILLELRKRNRDSDFSDFSVSKLMAGIVQVLALALLFVAYLNRGEPNFVSLMLSTIFLQTFTIALLIMGKQK